jgi:hypothetical protein
MTTQSIAPKKAPKVGRGRFRTPGNNLLEEMRGLLLDCDQEIAPSEIPAASHREAAAQDLIGQIRDDFADGLKTTYGTNWHRGLDEAFAALIKTRRNAKPTTLVIASLKVGVALDVTRLLNSGLGPFRLSVLGPEVLKSPATPIPRQRSPR